MSSEGSGLSSVEITRGQKGNFGFSVKIYAIANGLEDDALKKAIEIQEKLSKQYKVID